MKYDNKQLLIPKKSIDYILFKRLISTNKKVTRKKTIEEYAFLKRTSIDYKLAKLLGVINESKGNQEQFKYTQIQSNKDDDLYKKWGEVQFDGKGVEIKETHKRMIGFSKKNIRKVKL